MTRIISINVPQLSMATQTVAAPARLNLPQKPVIKFGNDLQQPPQPNKTLAKRFQPWNMFQALSNKVKLITAGSALLLLGTTYISCNTISHNREQARIAAERKAAEDRAQKEDTLLQMNRVHLLPDDKRAEFLKPYLQSDDPDVVREGIENVLAVEDPKEQLELLKPLCLNENPPEVQKALNWVVSNIRDLEVRAELAGLILRNTK